MFVFIIFCIFVILYNFFIFSYFLIPFQSCILIESVLQVKGDEHQQQTGKNPGDFHTFILFTCSVVGWIKVQVQNLIERKDEASNICLQKTKSCCRRKEFFKLIKITKLIKRFQVWDTGGQQRYRPVLASCYRGALGVIIVFDVTNMVRIFAFVRVFVFVQVFVLGEGAK